VDHGLQADSVRWREHCAEAAGALGVDFRGLSVTVQRIGDLGLEAAARAARYEALRTVLQPGEYLLTAHHADDQIETVLLALMRGAGLPGLSAMPAIQPFASGWLARPLLEFTRAELEAWARQQQLRWLSDPSNDNADLDRNYLRRHITPLLKERWPAAARTAARSAEHLQSAGVALDQLAATDAEHAVLGECLRVEALERLDPGRRRNLLRYWVRQRGARPPSTRKLAAMEHDMLRAAPDRQPCIEWDGWEVRRYRGLLYCAPELPVPPSESFEWRASESLSLPAGFGRLTLAAAPSGLATGKFGASLRVSFQAGEDHDTNAEALRLLKKKLHALVRPWWRERLPRIYSRQRLIAVADLWIAEEFAAPAGDPAVKIVWEERPAVEVIAG
jgi:tRNA(Ile)-lysidine synthase